MRFCAVCGKEIVDETAVYCPGCGAFVANSTYQPAAPTYPMKWYKFLINFLLYFSAVLNIGAGVLYITGGIYSYQSGNVSAELVYLFFDGLKTVDVIYGVFSIGIGVLGIYTRFMLAKYKSNGPTLLYALYIAGAVGTVIYNITAGAIIGVEISFTDIISSVAGSVIMVVANHKYFTNRASLFTN